jgi:hypothetical protein
MPFIHVARMQGKIATSMESEPYRVWRRKLRIVRASSVIVCWWYKAFDSVSHWSNAHPNRDIAMGVESARLWEVHPVWSVQAAQ